MRWYPVPALGRSGLRLNHSYGTNFGKVTDCDPGAEAATLTVSESGCDARNQTVDVVRGSSTSGQ
jgi:hypothetical protein